MADMKKQPPGTTEDLQAEQHIQRLAQSFSNAFENDTYADFTVQCANRKWRVHRLVISGQSPVFDKAFNGDFKEKNEKSITLEEDEPEIVNEMLRYFYTGQFVDACIETEQTTVLDPLMVDVRVMIIADKYDISPLLALAKQKFLGRVTSECGTRGFAAAIQEVYSTSIKPVEDLRTHLVGIAADHAKTLFTEKFGADFRAVAKTVPAFGSGLAEQIIEVKDRALEDADKAAKRAAEEAAKKAAEEAVQGLKERYKTGTCKVQQSVLCPPELDLP